MIRPKRFEQINFSIPVQFTESPDKEAKALPDEGELAPEVFKTLESRANLFTINERQLQVDDMINGSPSWPQYLGMCSQGLSAMITSRDIKFGVANMDHSAGRTHGRPKNITRMSAVTVHRSRETDIIQLDAIPQPFRPRDTL
jgi:hypothetical protein